MYTWNKKELERKKLLSLLLNKRKYYEHYSSILRQMDIKSKSLEPGDILLSKETETIDYDTSLAKFRTGLEYISEDIYTSLLDIYFKFGINRNLENELHLPKENITDDELVGIVHDMIERIHIIEYNKIYKKIKDTRKHYLNIQTQDESINIRNYQGIQGISLYDPLFRKSYINIFRTHTVMDIEILFHEVMHSIYYELFYKQLKDNNIRPLYELEGQLGSLYSYDYLRKIGFKKESELLLQDYIDNLLTTSYLLVINHALHVTAENKEFNIEAAESLINERLINKVLNINLNELPALLSFYGYENITTLIASLIALQINSTDYSSTEKFLLMHDIKEQDSTDIERTLRDFDVDYRSHNYGTLRKVLNK